MPHIPERPFPRDNDGLALLHEEVAAALETGLRRVGEALALTFGEAATHAALRALLVDTCHPANYREECHALFDRIGWREYLDTQVGQSIDTVELTNLWRDGAEYAGQGLAPREPFDQPASLADREARIKALIERSEIALDCAPALFGDTHLFIWKGVAARAAIDFGGTLTAEGLQLLSGVSPAAVRNAISAGELHPDAAGNIPADAAKAWLARRREFCPSRWTNPEDGQWPFDPSKAIGPGNKEMIWVPQDAEGTPFTPEHVVRTARSTTGLSITIGAKGAEKQYSDFYEALAALAKMDVARWRRRNSAGNWGIVRARGAWVAVSKAEIDRQLAEKVPA